MNSPQLVAIEEFFALTADVHLHELDGTHCVLTQKEMHVLEIQ